MTKTGTLLPNDLSGIMRILVDAASEFEHRGYDLDQVIVRFGRHYDEREDKYTNRVAFYVEDE